LTEKPVSQGSLIGRHVKIVLIALRDTMFYIIKVLILSTPLFHAFTLARDILLDGLSLTGDRYLAAQKYRRGHHLTPSQTLQSPLTNPSSAFFLNLPMSHRQTRAGRYSADDEWS
jgi:hypothetical protein